MADNQQIQNFITALEAADGVSVDADLTAESVTIEDDAGNQLAIDTSGSITVADDGSFEVAEILSNVTVSDDGLFSISSLPEPLDVSGATVTVTGDGSLNVTVDSLPEPLDVSGANVTVSDDGAFDINSLPEPVTVDAGITDADGDALEIAPSGAAQTVTDVSESLLVDNLTVPAGEVMFVPSGEEIGVMDLVVEDTATFVVDGFVEVFGTLTETGTIAGSGEVTDRTL